MIKRKSSLKPSKSLHRGFIKSEGKIAHKGKQVAKKRRKRTELTILKDQLWQLCREIQIKRYGRVCYTCGKTVEKSKGLHLGHFITSSTCSVAMRYDLRNLRPQCYHCNINLSGNWVAFSKKLREENGFGAIVEILIEENDATKGKVYPISWFQEKIAEYQKLL